MYSSDTQLLVETVAARPRQDLRTVVRAEVFRLLRQGGLRRGLLVSALIGLGVGLAAVAAMTYLGRGQADLTSSVPVTVPVEAAAATAAFFVSLSALLYHARTGQAGVLASLVLVPNRTRLLAAQVASLAAVAMTTTLAVTTVVAVAALAMSDASAGGLPAAIGVLSGSIAAALLAVIALFLAILINSLVVAILAYTAWWIVLPLTLSISSAALPGWAAPLAAAAVQYTPTVLLNKATTVSTLTTQGYATVLDGHVGLVAWVVVLGVVAQLAFRRRSF